MKSTKVYCIIVTYNAMKWVDKCFQSLSNSLIPINTVIIDNCSKDETVSYIQKKYPKVHVIVNEHNRGFGKANNQGIEWAYKQGATHFFLLNQDAWIEPDAISNLIAIKDRYNIAIAAPIHLNGTGEMMDFGYFCYIKNYIDERKLLADILKETPKDFYPVRFVNAAGWVVSRKTIEDIGGFDPIFLHYGEDRNYAQRLKYHHKTLAMIPSSIIYHDRDQHGNEKVYNKKRVVATLLREYADVNKAGKSLTWCRMKLQLWLMRDIINNLVRLKFDAVSDMMIGFREFYTIKGEIHKSIKENMVIKSNWLNL